MSTCTLTLSSDTFKDILAYIDTRIKTMPPPYDGAFRDMRVQIRAQLQGETPVRPMHWRQVVEQGRPWNRQVEKIEARHP